MPDEHGGAVIYTPSKVQAIRDANAQKEQDEAQKLHQRQERQLQIQVRKQAEHKAKAKRRQDRERAQAERRAQREIQTQQRHLDESSQRSQISLKMLRSRYIPRKMMPKWLRTRGVRNANDTLHNGFLSNFSDSKIASNRERYFDIIYIILATLIVEMNASKAEVVEPIWGVQVVGPCRWWGKPITSLSPPPVHPTLLSLVKILFLYTVLTWKIRWTTFIS
ncbi:MAG: hypothetical protein Q9165_008791 [Trypethelium subeluteriae]